MRQLDPAVLEALADIICGEGDTYRKGWEIGRFLQRADERFPDHDGSTRKWWTLHQLEVSNANVNDSSQLGLHSLEAVILRLADPREYQASFQKAEAIRQQLNSVLALDGLEVVLADTKPQMQVLALRRTQEAVMMVSTQSRLDVFVIHGRNEKARRAMFAFLRSIGLHPKEWSGLVAATGQASPYIGDVLSKAFSDAQAILVLMTPDEEVRLVETLRERNDSSDFALQPRPNVIFEAGMAMGQQPNRTVIVEIGQLRPFSDIAGRHVVRLDNSPKRRQELAKRLETAGCTVDLAGTDWQTEGDFDHI